MAHITQEIKNPGGQSDIRKVEIPGTIGYAMVNGLQFSAGLVLTDGFDVRMSVKEHSLIAPGLDIIVLRQQRSFKQPKQEEYDLGQIHPSLEGVILRY